MAKEIGALTGIRGIAAVWVVLYHAHAGHDGSGIRPQGALWEFFLNGYLAVDLFFVLSGFVMALSYGHYVRQGWTRPTYLAFLVRRFARIYPLYALMTLLVAGLIVAGISKSTELTAATFAANLLLVQAWGLRESLNSPAWSISTELAAYLLFPLLAVVTLKGSWTRPALTAAACMACLYCISQVATPPDVDARDGVLDIFWMPSFWPLLRCFSEFSLGLAAYRLHTHATVRRLFDRPAASFAIAAALLVALLIPEADMAVVAVLPLLLVVIAQGDNWLKRGLELPVVLFLGDISYSLYLVHSPLLRVRRIVGSKLTPHLGDMFSDVAGIIAFYTILLAMSYLTYRFVEKPCRRAIRRWEPATVPSPAQTDGFNTQSVAL